MIVHTGLEIRKKARCTRAPRYKKLGAQPKIWVHAMFFQIKKVCIDQFHEYANGVWSAYITNTILIFIVRSIISHYALIQGYCFG